MTDEKNLIKLWRNHESRVAFIDDYSKWGVWAKTPKLGLTYYRYELPDGTAIIAMRHKKKNWQSGSQWVDGVTYYVQRKDEPFTPHSASHNYAVAELLKDAKVKLQKRGA